MKQSTATALVLTFALTFLFSQQLSAQSAARIDTLKALLETKTDTSLANLYLYLAKDYGFFGKVPDSMEKYSFKALELSQKLGFDTGIERAYFCLGFVYDWKNEPLRSNEYYQQSFRILEKQNNKRGMAAVLNNIGKNYMEWENYERALDYFLRSTQIEESIDDGQPINPSYNNIAIILFYQGDYETALEYRKKAYHYAKKANDKIAIIQVYSNFASDFIKVEKPDSARYYGAKALRLSEEIGFIEGIIRTSNQMANINLRLEKLNDVLPHLEKALATADSQYHTGLIAYSTLLKSNYYKMRNQRDSALILAEKGLKYALIQNETARLSTAYEHMGEVYQHFGEFEKALKFHQKHQALNDSLHTLAKNRQIVEMQAYYESTKKEQKIAELAQENQIQELQLKQRNSALIAAFIGTILLLALGFLYFRQKILVEQQQTLEARQRFLLTQMNPHFFFHALSSIQNFIFRKEDPKITGAYLSKFAKLMRLVLENSRETYITLDREIDTLRFYLDLQRLRYRNGFDYEIELDEDLEPEMVMIPPMFAQPFIENSLEHGLANSAQKGLIKISFTEHDGMLDFTVEDNGVGLFSESSEEPKPKRKSLATEITRDRLKLLSKKIKQQVELNIINLHDENPRLSGTKVSFSLPLMYETGSD